MKEKIDYEEIEVFLRAYGYSIERGHPTQNDITLRKLEGNKWIFHKSFSNGCALIEWLNNGVRGMTP